MKDELANLLCPNSYKFLDTTPPASADPIPGQIVLAHTVYPPNAPWIVKVINYDPLNPSRSQYEIKQYSQTDRSHMPIKELELRADENYYVYIGKERPLVVVKGIGSHWRNPLRPENVFACVPVFSYKPRHSTEFRDKVMGFCYSNLFYLPSDGNGLPEDSAARFELMQPIPRRSMHNIFKGSPSRPIALSDEAFALFVNHLGRFLASRDLDSGICQGIDAYRSLVEEALREQGGKDQ